MDENFYKRLIEGYRSRNLSKEELAVYHQLLADGKLDKLLMAEMEDDFRGANQQRHRLTRPWIGIAAGLIIAFSVGYWSWSSFQGFQNEGDHLQTAELQRSSPTLVLPDGQTVQFIDSEKYEDQSYGFEGDENILIYHPSEDPAANDKLHTVATPKGRTYKIRLQDGTLVWLNAESSVTFPAAFSHQQREVEIIGEAYFEVAHEENRPFRVQSGTQVVTVLGTKFNISNFPQADAITTTLVEGSVQLESAKGKQLLRPNEQAVLRENEAFVVSTVNPQSYIAWTHGYLHFRDEPLSEILQKVARWYDVALSLDTSLEDRHYTLRFSQQASLQEFIDVLNEVGLHANHSQGILIVK